MKFIVLNEDITSLEVDAIVTPTNKFLTRGGGLNSKVHTKAGFELTKELFEIKKNLPNELKEGSCVHTKGYNLPCKFVIHTLGPKLLNYKNLEDEKKTKVIKKVLYDSYYNSLIKAETLNCSSIAFPLISGGNFGVHISLIKEILLEFKEDLKNIELKNIEEIYLVVYEKDLFTFFHPELHENN